MAKQALLGKMSWDLAVDNGRSLKQNSHGEVFYQYVLLNSQRKKANFCCVEGT